MNVLWSEASAVWRERGFVNVMLFRQGHSMASLKQSLHVASSMHYRGCTGVVVDLRHIDTSPKTISEVCAKGFEDTPSAHVALVVRSSWNMFWANVANLHAGQWAQRRVFSSRYSAKKWLARQSVLRRRNAAQGKNSGFQIMKPFVS